MRNRFAFRRWFFSPEKRGTIRLTLLVLPILLAATLIRWAGGTPAPEPPALPSSSPGGAGGAQLPLGAACHWMVASAESTPHSHPSAKGSPAAPPPDWEILGHYAEACNCEIGCPCIYKSPASHGECQATLAFSVTKGRFGTLDLSGLSIVLVGEVAKGGFISYYLDERATPQQREVLTGIFRGIFGMLSKNDLGVKAVPIRMDAGSPDSMKRTRGVTIPDILELEVEKVAGLDGQGPTRVYNPVHFINELLVAKSKTYRFKDQGRSWEYTGRSGFHGEFFFSSLLFK